MIAGVERMQTCRNNQLAIRDFLQFLPIFVTSELVARRESLLSLKHEILAAVDTLHRGDLRELWCIVRGFASACDCIWQMDDGEVDGGAGAKERDRP